MFSKQDIQKAIDVIIEEIKCIKMTEPQATVELDNLEFAVVSLEGYRDRESIDEMLREQENLAVLLEFF
jgi:hypothetical protein